MRAAPALAAILLALATLVSTLPTCSSPSSTAYPRLVFTPPFTAPLVNQGVAVTSSTRSRVQQYQTEADLPCRFRVDANLFNTTLPINVTRGGPNVLFPPTKTLPITVEAYDGSNNVIPVHMKAIRLVNGNGIAGLDALLQPCNNVTSALVHVDVVYSAADPCNNRTTEIRVTYRFTDKTPPQWSFDSRSRNGNRTLEFEPSCSSEADSIRADEERLLAAFSHPSVADECDDSSVLTITDTVASQSMAQGLCSQNRIVSKAWNAVDRCGNVGRVSQSIRVVDTRAPSLGAKLHIQVCPSEGNEAAVITSLPSSIVKLVTPNACDDGTDGGVSVQLKEDFCTVRKLSSPEDFEDVAFYAQIQEYPPCFINSGGLWLAAPQSATSRRTFEFTAVLSDSCGNTAEETISVSVFPPRQTIHPDGLLHCSDKTKKVSNATHLVISAAPGEARIARELNATGGAGAARGNTLPFVESELDIREVRLHAKTYNLSPRKLNRVFPLLSQTAPEDQHDDDDDEGAESFGEVYPDGATVGSGEPLTAFQSVQLALELTAPSSSSSIAKGATASTRSQTSYGETHTSHPVVYLIAASITTLLTLLCCM